MGINFIAPFRKSIYNMMTVVSGIGRPAAYFLFGKVGDWQSRRQCLVGSNPTDRIDKREKCQNHITIMFTGLGKDEQNLPI
jgi:hypothetical protein